MPIYEYSARDKKKSCDYCADGFELIRMLSDPAVECCPECGAAVIKLISACAVGGSQAGFDERAKKAGFSKLKRLGKGEYEKQY